MIPTKQKAFEPREIFTKEGTPISDQIGNGGVISATAHEDQEGFYIAVTTAAGVLSVVPYNAISETPVLMPFFLGWNPILVRKLVSAGATATGLYWGK